MNVAPGTTLARTHFLHYGLKTQMTNRFRSDIGHIRLLGSQSAVLSAATYLERVDGSLRTGR
jgi:hypothetical protein